MLKVTCHVSIYRVSFICIMWMIQRLIYRRLGLVKHHGWLMVYHCRLVNNDGRRLHYDAWPMNYDVWLVNNDIWTMVNRGWGMVDYWWSMHNKMVLFMSFGGFRFLFCMATCMVDFLTRFLGYRFFRMISSLFGCKLQGNTLIIAWYIWVYFQNQHSSGFLR